MTFFEATCTAPVNIAVVKYWGKRDTSLILPTNSSLSVTLSQDQLHSKTTIRASADFTSDRLWLNGIEESIEKNKRLVACLRETRALRAQIEAKDESAPKLSGLKIHICSENNFPTAAGLASSASGYACLVYTLSKLFELPLNASDLSIVARQGSGSACRSLFGGFVAWEMGEKEDGSDSRAVQVAPETHWPDLQALICVVSDEKKGTSSTEGMQLTVKTSALLQHRIKNVVPKRMEEMIAAIHNKDFPRFAELTMQDSNQFHAVCLDTYPPIFYMNDISRAIIRIISEYNKDGIKAAYTFDAGPNAVIYAPQQNMREIYAILSHYFPGHAFEDSLGLKKNDTVHALPQNFDTRVSPVFSQGAVKQILHTKADDGPRVLDSAQYGLLNAEGLPKRLA
ncbi:diphosphomevalonate decarboxylase [Lobosporangium transversale]|uniref:Diphosphomevalonate decarboxylase n=1 Tax=Lobosporangium transversale TaxID=64571 RepID=A0A1Y2GVZ4_9FUNG|nr:Diphosphomevalonate decarboxylase [Lobosporangium transversale]KAF9909032.1 diphosphomevalonate decarboxylase [Lobosporangium transversale]ORZ22874.1 Diphosphomevalonate decarboxylase [Lobosporangium transversale]|eukprot:XP_021883428.1 Diphosphomevalonate decarboxylase [Lobosporangium transversale]